MKANWDDKEHAAVALTLLELAQRGSKRKVDGNVGKKASSSGSRARSSFGPSDFVIQNSNSRKELSLPKSKDSHSEKKIRVRDSKVPLISVPSGAQPNSRDIVSDSLLKEENPVGNRTQSKIVWKGPTVQRNPSHTTTSQTGPYQPPIPAHLTPEAQYFSALNQPKRRRQHYVDQPTPNTFQAKTMQRPGIAIPRSPGIATSRSPTDSTSRVGCYTRGPHEWQSAHEQFRNIYTGGLGASVAYTVPTIRYPALCCIPPYHQDVEVYDYRQTRCARQWYPQNAPGQVVLHHQIYRPLSARSNLNRRSYRSESVNTHDTKQATVSVGLEEEKKIGEKSESNRPIGAGEETKIMSNMQQEHLEDSFGNPGNGTLDQFVGYKLDDVISKWTLSQVSNIRLEKQNLSTRRRLRVPKKPKSAYNFFQLFAQQVVQKKFNVKFKQSQSMMRTIGSYWYRIRPERRRSFELLAEEDVKRCELEQAIYEDVVLKRLACSTGYAQ
mmetsp:Transcript_31157/g.60991  ORF Transcript_31157/g.60991 Transcript_31157/m.60991 type:complete len:495 (-) Transcript_31157:260-1744(-)